MCKKMLRSSVIAFGIGFLAYAAIPVAMDLAYRPDSATERIWGLQFSVLWGGIGGITFVISWFCIVGLWCVATNLMDDKGS